jgi:hypothetical protein
MTKSLDLGVPCVVILGTERPHQNCTTYEGLENDLMRLSSPSAQSIIEAMVEYMEWEEKLLNVNMGLPKKNC